MDKRNMGAWSIAQQQKISPQHIRYIYKKFGAVSHFLGDGSLERYHCRWYQKSDIGGEYMIKLINILSKIKMDRKSKNSYSIPILLADIVSSALGVLRQDLNGYKLIKKIKFLPKPYKLQLLSAIIVDEGSITKSSIKISNTNLKLLEALKEIIISLNYPCSDIKNYAKNIGKTIIIKDRRARVNYNLKNLFIYADGLNKLQKDIKKMIKQYGEIAGLWHKQHLLDKWGRKVDLQKLKKQGNQKMGSYP